MTASAKILEVVLGQVLYRAKLDTALERVGLMDSLRRIGINDVFGQSGTPAECLEHYGLTAPKLAKNFAGFIRG